MARKRTWRKQRNRVRALYERWKNILALYEWDLPTTYESGPMVIDGAENAEAAACASVRWQYRSATLRFNVEECAKMDDDELERCYVHECMHVLLAEMREKDHELKHEERSATMLAWALVRARKDGGA